MATKNTDKVQVHASLSALEVESTGEAYRFALSGNKIITFPNPQDMGWKEAEEFMSQVDGNSDAQISDVLASWLSEEDFQKLSDENLSLGQISALMKLVTAHYEAIFGTGPNA